MKNHILFDVFAIDTEDQNGIWIETDRHHIGKLKYYANSVKEIDAKKMLCALADTYVRSPTGRSVPLLKSTDLRSMYFTDIHGDEHFFEIGIKKERKPLYLLAMIGGTNED